jgi:hypothetical protein
MSKIARFVIWICSKFTKNEIQQIIVGLLDVLEDRNPPILHDPSQALISPPFRYFNAMGPSLITPMRRPTVPLSASSPLRQQHH